MFLENALGTSLSPGGSPRRHRRLRHLVGLALGAALIVCGGAPAVATTTGDDAPPAFTAPDALVAPVSDLTTTPPDETGNWILSGKGEPTSTITVRDASGAIIDITQVSADLTWSATIPARTPMPLSITQTVAFTSETVIFVDAPLPLLSPQVGALAAAVAVIGSTIWVKRRLG